MNFLNGNGNKGWCPICEEHNQRLSEVAAFWNHNGKIICYYRMCRSCVAKVQKEGPTAELGKMIESNLLNKFPNLWKLLPDDYGSCEAASFSDEERENLKEFCRKNGIKNNIS